MLSELWMQNLYASWRGGIMLNATKERFTELVNDPEHLRRLVILWPENHLMHHLAKAHLEALEKLVKEAADAN
ncbi:hypothetical protein WCT84_15990 [Pectobacterium brasiliense]|uniref:hypothetical protein n=1 Tax=Pectobacterium brasiliense TaxID=180957 RepID=UPI003017F2A8